MDRSARGTQIINGTEYVYEYQSIWNAQKQRSEQKTKLHWQKHQRKFRA